MKTPNISLARRAIAVGVSALLLAAGGCSDDDGDTSADTTVTDDDSTTSVSSPTVSSSATTASAPSSSAATTTGGTGPSTSAGSTTLPGEEFDSFAAAGDALGVVGVAHDDVLNIRVGPGADQDIATSVDPVADDLVSTGRARALTGSIWYEISVGDTTGWANSRFLAFIGGTDDATAGYLAGRDRPSAETMTDLGRIVAEDFASTDPASTIVQSVGPTVGDLGEVTFDVIGIGDDAQIGYRIHVFAVEDDSGEAWVLRTIERTSMCTRGVTGELCN